MQTMRQQWGGLWTCTTGGIRYLPRARALHGYFPNASKTWLVNKEGLHDAAVSFLANTGVSVTSNGRQAYLGAAIGSREYVAGQVESKVNEWTSNIQCLATIPMTQPHAAYTALTHGLMSKWTYLSRTIPDIGPLLRPLDDALHSVLFPALTGRPLPRDLECKLFALPARLGGLGLSVPSRSATLELQFLATRHLHPLRSHSLPKP